MATHSSVLAWRIQGWRSLVGCHLWGLTELDTAEAMQQQQQQQQQQAPWRSENTLAFKLLYNTVSKTYISCVHVCPHRVFENLQNIEDNIQKKTNGIAWWANGSYWVKAGIQESTDFGLSSKFSSPLKYCWLCGVGVRFIGDNVCEIIVTALHSCSINATSFSFSLIFSSFHRHWAALF